MKSQPPFVFVQLTLFVQRLIMVMILSLYFFTKFLSFFRELLMTLIFQHMYLIMELKFEKIFVFFVKWQLHCFPCSASSALLASSNYGIIIYFRGEVWCLQWLEICLGPWSESYWILLPIFPHLHYFLGPPLFSYIPFQEYHLRCPLLLFLV